MSGGEATTLGKRDRVDEDEDHPMDGVSAAKVQPNVGNDNDDDDDDIGPMPMPDDAEEAVQTVRKKRKGTSVNNPIFCTTFTNN